MKVMTFAVAMIVLSAAIMPPAASTPHGVKRSSGALDVARSSNSTNRYLKSNANMTASHDTSTSEERMEGPAEIKESLARISVVRPEWLEHSTQTTPLSDDLLLKFKAAMNLEEPWSDDFINHVCQTDKITCEKVARSNKETDILSILVEGLKPENPNRDFAKQLLELELKKYEKILKPKVTFQLLKLNINGQMPFDSPAFPLWVKSSKQYIHDWRAMRLTLKNYFGGDENLVHALLPRLEDGNEIIDFAGKMIDYTLKTMFSYGEAKDTFKLLKLNEAGIEVFERPAFLHWVKLVVCMQKNRVNGSATNTIHDVLVEHFGGDSQLINALREKGVTEATSTKATRTKVARTTEEEKLKEQARLLLNEFLKKYKGIIKIPAVHGQDWIMVSNHN